MTNNNEITPKRDYFVYEIPDDPENTRLRIERIRNCADAQEAAIAYAQRIYPERAPEHVNVMVYEVEDQPQAVYLENHPQPCFTVV